MNQEVIEKIKSILDVSSRLHQIFNKDKETEVKNAVQFLNTKLDEEKLKELHIKYPRDTDQPINKIRALVADKLISKKQQKQLITKEDIEKIKTSVAKEYDSQVLKAWGSYFKLLLPFFYNDKLKAELNDIANYLIEKTKLNEFVSIKVVDFMGPQSQGSPDAWLAIYNKEQKSQADSWQFYIGFNNDVMKFGLYQHQNDEEKDMKIQKISDINLEEIAKHLAYFSETIKNDKPSSQDNSNSTAKASNRHEKFPSNLNQILYGPPGTGKTYITAERAIKICASEFTPDGNTDQEKRKNLMSKYKALQENQIAFVTFHQSYGYEEFVEGLRPVINQENADGQVRYEIRAGAFKELCEKAREDKNKNFVIIIDEINRGNISKIFGELITLLEEDKREGQLNELSVTLPYSQDLFSIPVNVYVIGTMNTADRSLAQVDIALRRRFHFEEMMPNYSVLKNLNVKGINVEEMLETINKRIEALYDRDHTIGHAYFTSLAEIVDEEEKFEKLKEIFKFKVMPLLQEYFFDDWQKIKLVLGDKFVKESLVSSNLFDKSEEVDLSDKKLYRFDDEALINLDAYKAISPKQNSQAENDTNQA